MLDRQGGEGSEAQRVRRRAIRHNCKVAIQMLISHSSGYSETWTVDAIRIEGRVLDLSGGGASLFTKQAFETGQELRLTIKMREGEKISTNAVVRWVKAVPDKGAFASGVQFKEVSKSDAERIEAFLKYLDKSAGL